MVSNCRREKLKIIIATKNVGKIEGAKRAFERFFDHVDIVGIPASSNVAEQPVNEDTYLGAKNRVHNLKEYCRQQGIVADLYLGVESGIVKVCGKWTITNIAIIEDNDTFSSYGTSPSFPVPDSLVKQIIDTDLSQVMDKVFYEDKERHNHGGGIQMLTKGNVSRIDLTEYAFIMALTSYLNQDKWYK